MLIIIYGMIILFTLAIFVFATKQYRRGILKENKMRNKIVAAIKLAGAILLEALVILSIYLAWREL